MEIKVLNDLYTDENTYFIIENHEAIVIDPGVSYEKILSNIYDIKIKYILLTHCHYDHIGSVNKLISCFDAKICCTEECAENIKNVNISLTQMGLGKPEIIENAHIIFNDGDEFDFSGNKIKVIKTPGHTSCSVCYMIEDNLFTGDTLFFQNVGRWDLPTGNGETLIKSIKEKIYSLDDDITVYPGHGNKTSVGYEKKFNFYVNEKG